MKDGAHDHAGDEMIEMKTDSAFEPVLLCSPFHRGMVELAIVIGTGVCGLVFSWTTFSVFPASNIFGGVLILSGLIFHCLAEKDHRKAHERSSDIETIVTTGVYSRIRHPLYLGIIVMNLGIGLAFGVLTTQLIALLTIVHWTATALREEVFLSRRFPEEYGRYRHEVRWRMIPWIF